LSRTIPARELAAARWFSVSAISLSVLIKAQPKAKATGFKKAWGVVLD
jgi:hypothetical protein